LSIPRSTHTSRRSSGRGAHSVARRRGTAGKLGEAFAVGASPAVCFFGLRLRAMAPPVLPDPALTSSFVWNPQQLTYRYAEKVYPTALRAYIGPPAAYFRWGTRAGFLVPARLAFLALGAVGGFFALRYLLALVAVGPAYLLAKRLWGAWAGILAVVLVMASPVIVTAWGTDFPDSAAVSFLIGGTACLVMPAPPRARRAWLVVSAVLFSAAVWALATTGVLVAVTLLAWLAVRLAQRPTAGRTAEVERTGAQPSATCRSAHRPAGVLADIAVLGLGAAATTLALAVGSWVLLGRFDFIAPTLRAVEFLATPAQERLWHSSDPAWAPYDDYLLVLPVVAVVWVAAVASGSGRRRPETLTVGAAALGELVLACYLQFAGGVQILENHYLSSSLWATSTLALLVALAELWRPFATRPVLRYLPAGAVVAVAGVSEIAATPPAFGWVPFGLLVSAVAVTSALVVACADRSRRPRPALAGGALGLLLASLLLLTIVPSPPLPPYPHVVYDPATSYDEALGGRADRLVDQYRLEYLTLRFVPEPTYRGEQLLTCRNSTTSGLDLQLIGLFHAGVNLLPGTCPRVPRSALRTVVERRAAQILMVSARPVPVGPLLRRLASLHPRVVRHVRLNVGNRSCWLWLIDIPRYLRNRSR